MQLIKMNRSSNPLVSGKAHISVLKIDTVLDQSGETESYSVAQVGLQVIFFLP